MLSVNYDDPALWGRLISKDKEAHIKRRYRYYKTGL